MPIAAPAVAVFAVLVAWGGNHYHRHMRHKPTDTIAKEVEPPTELNGRRVPSLPNVTHTVSPNPIEVQSDYEAPQNYMINQLHVQQVGTEDYMLSTDMQNLTTTDPDCLQPFPTYSPSVHHEHLTVMGSGNIATDFDLASNCDANIYASIGGFGPTKSTDAILYSSVGRQGSFYEPGKDWNPVYMILQSSRIDCCLKTAFFYSLNKKYD